VVLFFTQSTARKWCYCNACSLEGGRNIPAPFRHFTPCQGCSLDQWGPSLGCWPAQEHVWEADPSALPLAHPSASPSRFHLAEGPSPLPSLLQEASCRRERQRERQLPASGGGKCFSWHAAAPCGAAAWLRLSHSTFLCTLWLVPPVLCCSLAEGGQGGASAGAMAEGRRLWGGGGYGGGRGGQWAAAA